MAGYFRPGTGSGIWLTTADIQKHLARRAGREGWATEWGSSHVVYVYMSYCSEIHVSSLETTGKIIVGQPGIYSAIDVLSLSSQLSVHGRGKGTQAGMAPSRRGRLQLRALPLRRLTLVGTERALRSLLLEEGQARRGVNPIRLRVLHVDPRYPRKGRRPSGRSSAARWRST